jgi:hypothetical protein
VAFLLQKIDATKKLFSKSILLMVAHYQ